MNTAHEIVWAPGFVHVGERGQRPPFSHMAEPLLDTITTFFIPKPISFDKYVKPQRAPPNQGGPMTAAFAGIGPT